MNDLFAKDTGNVFYIEGTVKDANSAPLEAPDDENWPAHYGGTEHAGFARDGAKVYYYRMDGGAKPAVLRGADRDGFRVMRYHYATDGTRVYWATHHVKGADSRTFEVLHLEYARDGAAVSHAREMIAGAAPRRSVSWTPRRGSLKTVAIATAAARYWRPLEGRRQPSLEPDISFSWGRGRCPCCPGSRVAEKRSRPDPAGRGRGGGPFFRLKADADKVARAGPVATMYLNGLVHHAAGADWLANYEDELLSFPRATSMTAPT